MKPDLARIQRGDITNLSYDDLVRLAQELGFREVGGRDSHRVSAYPDLAELINLQVGRGQAKRYSSGRWRPGTPVRFVVGGAMNPGLMFGVHGAQRPIREIINRHSRYTT